MAKNWIAGALVNKGALHKVLGKKIGTGKLSELAGDLRKKAGTRKLTTDELKNLRRANLAKTLILFNKKKIKIINNNNKNIY